MLTVVKLGWAEQEIGSKDATEFKDKPQKQALPIPARELATQEGSKKEKDLYTNVCY